jgi:hypothetical protein
MIKTRRTAWFIFGLIVAAVVTPPLHTLAATTNFVPLTSLPSVTRGVLGPNNDNFIAFFNSLYRISIGVAATLAFFQIVKAGLIYMGGDSITETKVARDGIASAILGLIVVLSPVIVFSIINPKILTFNIGLSGLSSSGVASQSPEPLPGTLNPKLSGCSSYTKFTIAPYKGCVLPNTELDDACCTVDGSAFKTAQSCCGLSKTYKPPVTTPVVSSATFKYFYSIAHKSNDGGGACVDYATNDSYPDLASCNKSYNFALSKQSPGYFIVHACSDSGLTAPKGLANSHFGGLKDCATH